MTVAVLIVTLAFQSLQASSPHLTVEVLDRGSDESGARLMIARTDTTRYHLVTLNRALGRVTSIRLRDDEERVVAMTERGFAVLDPGGRAARDEVYGYDVTPSPDLRWIAYLRNVRDDTGGDSGDGILIYDTMRTPDQNRAAFPITAERSSAAGSPVYPPEGEWHRSSGVEPSRPHSAGRQWWSTQTYISALMGGATDRLIVADVSQPVMRVCTRALRQDADRWAQARIDVLRLDGDLIVQIHSPARGAQPETVTFAPNCDR